jgi:hypothetical protein
MLNFLFPILLSLTPSDTTKVNVHVNNTQHIQKIGDRDVTFGIKETVEELLIEKGYTPNDSLGIPVQVSIDSIYSPQQIVNIMGIQWLKKDYFVETTICIGNSCFKSVGVRKTFIFAAFLNVENNEVPLNRKAFSKALQESLTKTTKQL